MKYTLYGDEIKATKEIRMTIGHGEQGIILLPLTRETRRPNINDMNRTNVDFLIGRICERKFYLNGKFMDVVELLDDRKKYPMDVEITEEEISCAEKAKIGVFYSGS